MTDWNLRYIRLAQHVSEWSKDPSTRVGAVIVGKKRSNIALGYNGFPRGIMDHPDRLMDRGMKYTLTQHAERNALDNAGFDVEGGRLIVTAHPCADCAKSIIQRGIKCVVCPPSPEPDPERPWTASCQIALQLFREACVDLVYFPNG